MQIKTAQYISAIQRIITGSKAKTYLEIGLYTGHCILQLSVKNKIGVDPDLSKARAGLGIAKALGTNKHTRFYELTSDAFFEKKV